MRCDTNVHFWYPNFPVWYTKEKRSFGLKVTFFKYIFILFYMKIKNICIENISNVFFFFLCFCNVPDILL